MNDTPSLREAVIDDRAPMTQLTALLSVSDKTGVLELARELASLGVKLLSTGGTARLLADAGLEVTEVAAHTAFRRCSTAPSRRCIRRSTAASSPAATRSSTWRRSSSTASPRST